MPGLGLVEAEHVIVGGIIHLPAELPTTQHGYQESRRQQPGVRCCSSPASWFHSFKYSGAGRWLNRCCEGERLNGAGRSARKDRRAGLLRPIAQKPTLGNPLVTFQEACLPTARAISYAGVAVNRALCLTVGTLVLCAAADRIDRPGGMSHLFVALAHGQ